MRSVVIVVFGLLCVACGGGGAPKPLATPDFVMDCAALTEVGEATFNSDYVGKTILLTGVVKTGVLAGEFSMEGASSSCFLKRASGNFGPDSVKKGESVTAQCSGKKWSMLGPNLDSCRELPAAAAPE